MWVFINTIFFMVHSITYIVYGPRIDSTTGCFYVIVCTFRAFDKNEYFMQVDGVVID